MSLLAPEPIVLSYQELPGAVSVRELAEHYKLYVGYRDMLQRVDAGLSTTARPAKAQNESPYSGLLWGQNYALAGAHLHELYFGNLAINSLMVMPGIMKLIDQKWGSEQGFENEFRAAGLEARGWVVLGVCHKCPKDLRIFAMDAHDLGAVYGYCPLLVIDTYEHAYWMDFGTDKGSYLKNVLRYVDWPTVDARYNEVHPPQVPAGVAPLGPPMTYSYDRSK